MACRPASSPSSFDISKSSPLSARFVVKDAMTRTTSSRERFSLPKACARLGSFQTAGSSSSALTSARRRDFSSQSKIPPELSGALSQVGDLGAQGVDAFDVHVKSCESWGGIWQKGPAANGWSLVRWFYFLTRQGFVAARPTRRTAEPGDPPKGLPAPR